jgi:putative copper export protein
MVALEATVSGLSYIVLALLVGTLTTAGFLLPAGEPKDLRKSLESSAPALLFAFLLLACLSLFVQGAKLRGGAIPSAEIVFRYLTMTRSGKVWLLRELYGAGLALITLWLVRSKADRRQVRLVAVFALPLLASRSLTSHAAAVREATSAAVAADALHLIGTGLWGGGLVTLCWVLYLGTRQSATPLAWAAEMVRRFSLLALASVAVLLLSGLYQSWIQVGNFTILFATDYGRVLLIKVVLFVGMLGLGALNLLSTRPTFIRATQRSQDELPAAKKALRRIGAESFLALLVFSLTGLLTTLPPGVHAAHQAALAKGPLRPGEPIKFLPADGASVKILSPARGQVFPTDQVPLKFELTRGKRGDHVHAYVDGDLMGMFLSKEGALNGIKPGRHVLELRVVADDHQTELDAADRTEFIVK